MEPQVKTFGIPNELCRRAGISAKWLPLNQIGVFPSQRVESRQRDAVSAYATNSPASIFHVRQEVVLFHPILRRLVNEASGVFINVQRLINGESDELQKELIQSSVAYRSIIRACLENLRDEVMRSEGAEKEELQNYVTIFYSVECIWHLCEILYIDNIPGYVVIKHLLDWVRFHFPKYERKAANLLTGDLLGLENHPDYWETVIGSLLQGRIEIVRALLGLHSMAHSPHFKLADQILRTMPVYDVYRGISLTEFNMSWKHWLVDLQAQIDAQMFTSEKQLNYVMRLLVGEELAWTQAQSRCEAWYELLAAYLYYTEPTVKSFELGMFARKCIDRMDVTMHHLDRVLLAAMDGDIELMKEIQHMTENGWFVTHLSDLLYHVGQLDKWQEDKSKSAKLRESFIVEYGTLLMSHQSLWQIGLSYLDHCPKEGIGTIALLLPRISINSEAKANKVIREAQKRELLPIVYSISKIQGMNELRKGRLGNALIWALKSQDTSFVSFLADQFLKRYMETGVLRSTDLLDNLGSCMMASDRLIFLGKYYEFHKLYRLKNYKEAAAAIVSLIVSKFTPKFFWLSLVTDTITLLEFKDLVLTSNDILNILNCLEERAHYPELKEQMDILRMAITRNLSRTLTYEAQFL